MNFPAFLGISSALIQAVLAVIVIIKGAQRACNKLFSLLLLLFTCWSLAELNLIFGGITEIGVKILFTPGILLAYFFCVFTAIYPEHQPNAIIISSKYRPVIFFIPAAILLYLLWSGNMLSEFSEIAGGFSLNFGKSEFIVKGIVIAYLFLSLSTLSNSRQKADGEIQARRLRYTFTAMLLPIAAGSITIAMSKWYIGGTTVYSFGLFPVLSIIMSIILSYTMLKYNLMEIDLIFSIGLVYTLLTAILAGSMELVQELMQEILNFSDAWSKIIAILLIAAIFTPLKEFLINLVNRFFGRQNFDSARVMQTILTEIRKLPEQNKLFTRFISELQLVLDFSSATVFFDSGCHASFPENIAALPPATALRKLPENLNELESIIHYYATISDTEQQQTATSLKQCDVRHYFDFRNSNFDSSYGQFLLGPKNSKVPYTETELNLVQGLVNEIPHIIENLKMISRLLNHEKTAQEIIWAGKMLEAISVKTTDQYFGKLRLLSFASLSSEIKGDMLDVCEIPDNCFIGLYDAFNQGIPAVLTLNIIFSIFRCIPEHCTKLLKANQLLKHFSQKKLCSAITIFSISGNKVDIFNAGNPPPILIRGGKLKKLKNRLSKPIGLEEQPELDVCDILLAEDDLLFCSTNGLYKAFKQMKGIDLEDFLSDLKATDARTCRQMILEAIEPFTRKTYSDDITFMVAGLK
ncbi:MAG: hypothetical protein EOM80_03225 [Erysipelotrichia bacterium]|nr:hypothetical protein [Erysipelotrichia bacterium]